MIDKQVAHYRIIEKLGEGGMGVVYKARDTHLDRFVAIKVLPPEKVADASRKGRFVQEAKAASALNHPNIITVYDIDSDGGSDFIAMEYVAGKTLEQLIGRKGLALNETLQHAIQIADALARAHAAGIVHRDLKPSNVMRDEHGLVKVLDFGLAKLTESLPTDEDASTQTVRAATEEGTILGTAAYMSPEQAEGKTVDARSDIFSFGAVLYEMVTGRRAFQGDSKMSTLSAVLHQEPKPIEGVPHDLEKIITRCLRKDSARRFQTMADLKVALQELKEESDSGRLAGASQSPRRVAFRPRWITAVSIVVAAVLVAVWLGVFSRRVPPPSDPVPLTSYPGFEGDPAFSPDGNQVAFVWDGKKRDNRDIYVKLIGSGDPLRLTTDAAADYSPAWSPDGRWIAFLRNLPGERAAVMTISPVGGPERKLTEVAAPGWWMPGPFVAWALDSVSLAFVDRASGTAPFSLFLLPADGSGKNRLTVPPTAAFSDAGLAFSPDGRGLAFCRTSGSTDLHVLALTPELKPAGEPRQLAARDWSAGSPSWVETGSWFSLGTRRDIVFSSTLGRTGLWRIAASGSRDPERLAYAGQEASYPVISTRSHRLVYARSTSQSNISRIDAATGATAPLIASTRSEWNPMFSPDGKRIAFNSSRSGSEEIWVSNSDGSDVVQVTSFGAPMTGTPRWTPDSNSIVFESNIEGQFEEYVVAANGGKPRRLTTYPANDMIASYSRDGRWLYFASNRSGDFQVWKMPADGGEPVQVTRRGGFQAFESADSKWLFYLRDVGSRGSLWKVPSSGGEETQILELVIYRAFAVTAEGIYYLTDAKTERPAGGKTLASLQFLSFATGQTKPVATVENPGFGLSVSPDRKQILYTWEVQRGSDLMLVENFR